MPSVPTKILGYLNQGDTVVAELDRPSADVRCFVVISPVDKPGVPRERRRYVNSKYTMWEYWNYHFRRMCLRPGWEAEDWDYDLYLTLDERRQTTNESEFDACVEAWIPDPGRLVHIMDSDCPI